jgi:hypothetical protein
MTAPDSSPLMTLTWTDHVTGRQGFLVVERLVRGVCSGGLRMRAGCTLEEVAGLAHGMTMKEALHYDPGARYVPLGGAKGGIDCDPHDPEAYGVLVRYLRAMRPYIERFWTTGEDLGLTQDLVDGAAFEAGLVSSIQAVYPLLDDEGAARRRLAAAFAVEVEGIGLDELVGGCGVAESVLAALDRAGVPYEGTRVAVQGLGTMGGATARACGSSPSPTSRARSQTRQGSISRRCSPPATPSARWTAPPSAPEPTPNSRGRPGWRPKRRCWSRPRSRTPSMPPTSTESRRVGWSRRPTCRSCRRPRSCLRRAG